MVSQFPLTLHKLSVIIMSWGFINLSLIYNFNFGGGVYLLYSTVPLFFSESLYMSLLLIAALTTSLPKPYILDF